MNFPWLGLTAISILSSALSRCSQGCMPVLGHGPKYGLVPFKPKSPLPLWLEVIWLRFVPGAFPSVAPRSGSSFTQFGLCGIVWAILHSWLRCITSFLPFLYGQGKLSLQPPFVLARSPNRELCLFSLSPLCCPWGYVTVFCNAET